MQTASLHITQVFGRKGHEPSEYVPHEDDADSYSAADLGDFARAAVRVVKEFWMLVECVFT